MENETELKKKRTPVFIIIAGLVVIVAGVLCFSLFSKSAKSQKEFEKHISNAEKYLDVLDYENAIAEYEEALKLNPQSEDTLKAYIDAVSAYADMTGETDAEQANGIIDSAIAFLGTLQDVETTMYINALGEKYIEEGENLAKTNKDESNEIMIDEDDSEQVTDIDTPYINEDGYLVFGKYEQDGDESNGPELIEWEILDENENGTLVVSRYILEQKPFNDEFSDITWENSTIREWLNEVFYNTAFSDEQKKLINDVEILNTSPYWMEDDNNYVNDKVFLLSFDEMTAIYDISFYNASKDGYSQQLIAEATPYASEEWMQTYQQITSDIYNRDLKSKGYTEECIGFVGQWWWTRSFQLIDFTGSATTVDSGSTLDGLGYAMDVNAGVRPAIYVSY